MVDTKDKKVWAVAVGLVAVMACSVYAGAGMMNTPVTNLVGDGGANDTTDTPYVPLAPVINDTDDRNNSLPLPPTQDITNDTPNTPAPTEHVNPNLHMSISDNYGAFEYGVPNYFTVGSTEYGPNQPSEPLKVTHMIRISNIDNKSIEVRTYPYSPDSRLVNLYGDGQGGVYGILVADWSTWDYTWTYEKGVTNSFYQQVSVNVSAYGNFTVSIYAIHDDGDGSYDVISNTITLSFGIKKPTPAFDNYFMYGGNKDYIESTFMYGNSIGFVVRVDRNGYVGTIHNEMLVSETSGLNSIQVDGVSPPVSLSRVVWSTNGGTYSGPQYDVQWWDTGSYVEYTITLKPYDSDVHILFTSEVDGYSVTCQAYFHTTY